MVSTTLFEHKLNSTTRHFQELESLEICVLAERKQQQSSSSSGSALEFRFRRSLRDSGISDPVRAVCKLFENVDVRVILESRTFHTGNR